MSEVACSTCNGTGKKTSIGLGSGLSRVICPTCGGKKVVEVPEDRWGLEGVIFDAERRIAKLDELDDIRDVVLIDRMMTVLKRLRDA